MDPQDEALVAWEQRLRLAEDDLQQREQQALASDPSPAELLALASEHDKIALDRDNIASSYDERAAARDWAGLDRDVAGSGRDRSARAVDQDKDVAFPNRLLAGEDRDLAAGDRGDSYDDRSRSRQARGQAADDRNRATQARDRAGEKATEQEQEIAGLRAALESRQVIGQAQGVLMARYKVSADAAFAVLVRLSQNSNVKLRDVAAQLAERAPTDDS